jgi:pimeloyl-ACP methyl ester carboxylesterase
VTAARRHPDTRIERGARPDRTPEYGRALAAAIPGATYVEVAGAGHAATIQCAGEVTSIVARHLAQ